jgi:hypothetical protein
MLREHVNVRQEPGQRRRWFEDDHMDLIVWLEADGAVRGFQLCRSSEALTWRRGAGFEFGRIDEGDDSPLKNQTPVIVPNGNVAWDDMIVQFRSRSAQLEPALRGLVLERLEARN